MKDNKNSTWTWPDELDALTAAPEHHKLLLENDAVMVLDTLIRPNETTPLHTHKWPATLYILSWSDFIRYDNKNNIVGDSRNFDKSPLPSTAVWTEPLVPHRLENVGENDIHIISVEIKNK
jgi:hypothetical protein